MDPFKSAQTQVAELQEKYHKLDRAIPKLQEIEKQLDENITTLRKQEANIVRHLDDLQGEIERRTTAFNEWQRTETEKITVGFQSVEDKRKATEENIAKETETLRVRQTETANKEAEVKALLDKLAETRREVEIVQRINGANARQLQEREEEVKKHRTQNIALQDELTAKSKDLDSRESTILGNEEKTSVALKRAEEARDAATLMLDNAKDKIIATKTKETELDKREIALNIRQKELEKVAISLDDRRKVIETNTNS